MATAISAIKGRRIGLLGGTFDPVHNGHLAAARAVRTQLGLDAVLLLPAAIPPHKSSGRISSFTRRASMLEMAVAAEPGIFVCLVEQERGGPSYTIDTLIYLRKKLPAPRFYFIIGADVFAEIHTWKDYDDLPWQAHLVILNRPGWAAANAELMASYFPAFAYDQSAMVWQAEASPGKFYFLDMPPLDISSSRLRRKIAAGLDVNAYVPPAVADYISRHGLYGIRNQESGIRNQVTGA
ncbi:MAG: nicotinate (nicotinamide) nucleotide adenylyltransferase [Deltaproteobacteria bacterium]|nr:nicotinate (nicotinamide) nucleotide adenylyltransferase [Deltaproteobacteria bacterium]